MIIAIDTETQGLDATKFITGCIVYENGKSEVFRDKKKLRERILALGEKMRKRKKRLIVYAHNLEYDYVSCEFHKDERMDEYCSRPFLVNYEEEGQNPIKFIDTMGLWNGALATLGEEIGVPKTPTPEWLKLDKYEPTEKELEEAESYMIQDAKILIDYIAILKRILKEEKIWAPLLFTIPQISYSGFISYLRKLEGKGERRWDPFLKRPVSSGVWMQDIQRGEMIQPKAKETIEKANRGGRTECFQTGAFEKVHSADVNSLYPHIAVKMRFPNLHTEREIKCDEKTIPLDKIGVSTVLVKSIKEKIGVLPVRVREGEKTTSQYPNRGEYLYGTWTHTELAEAVKEGYRIISVDKTIIWEDGANPLKKYMHALYARKATEKGFKRTFFKMLMNGLIGKFSQKRPHIESKLVDVEEIPLYREQGWEVTALYGFNVRIEKKGKMEYKRSYCPIINALVTAGSRIHMYRLYKEIPKGSLLYSDTDSVYWNGVYCSPTVYKYGKGLGELKLENKNEKAFFYRRKAYQIGNTIKLNRIPKSQVTEHEFNAGRITYKEIIKLKESREHAGKQRIQSLELEEQKEYEDRYIFVDLEESLPEETWNKLKWDLTHDSSESSISLQESS